jgi:hypothetical protein
MMNGATSPGRVTFGVRGWCAVGALCVGLLWWALPDGTARDVRWFAALIVGRPVGAPTSEPRSFWSDLDGKYRASASALKKSESRK